MARRLWLQNPLIHQRTPSHHLVSFRSPVTFARGSEPEPETEPMTPSEMEARAVEAYREQLRGVQEFEGYRDFDLPYVNPSKLVRERGAGIFSQMMDEDDMCSSAMFYLIFAVLSSGYTITPGGDQPMDLKASDWQKRQVAELPGSFAQNLMMITRMVAEGFSVQEIVYGDQILEGEWFGKVPIVRLPNKSVKHIEFKVNSYGRVVRDGVWQKNFRAGSSGAYTKVNLENVIYTAWDPSNDNPYGNALLQKAYQWYYLKTYVVRSWGRTIERFGMPNVYGITPSTKKGEARTKVLTWLNELRKNMVSVFSKDVEVKVLESKIGDSVRTFQDAVDASNRGIARAGLLPAMVMDKDGSGSLALTKDQSQTQFMWPVGFVAQQVEDTVQSQFFRRDHLLNFDRGVAEPRFSFNAFVKEDLELQLRVYEAVQKWGFVLQEKTVAENFNIPIADKDADDLLKAPIPAPMQIPQAPELEEQVAAARTQMFFDAVRGELGPLKTWYNPSADSGRVLAQKAEQNPNQDGLRALEAAADVKGTIQEEDAAVEHWSEVGGISMTEIAEEVERKTLEGKSAGARLPE